MHDVYNVDALMGSTEQAIFASLRTTFDHKFRNGTVGDPPQGDAGSIVELSDLPEPPDSPQGQP